MSQTVSPATGAGQGDLAPPIPRGFRPGSRAGVWRIPGAVLAMLARIDATRRRPAEGCRPPPGRLVRLGSRVGFCRVALLRDTEDA